jgi:hypothetical protein
MLDLRVVVFREDNREGGTVVEYQVDGRVKTQTVPRMVGELLEALVDQWKKFDEAKTAFEEWKHERSERTDGRDGSGAVKRLAGDDAGRGGVKRPAARKEKAVSRKA